MSLSPEGKNKIIYCPQIERVMLLHSVKKKLFFSESVKQPPLESCVHLLLSHRWSLPGCQVLKSGLLPLTVALSSDMWKIRGIPSSPDSDMCCTVALKKCFHQECDPFFGFDCLREWTSLLVITLYGFLSMHTRLKMDTKWVNTALMPWAVTTSRKPNKTKGYFDPVTYK